MKDTSNSLMYQRMFNSPNCHHTKKDDSIKLALFAKPINRQLFKKVQCWQTAGGISQIVTANTKGTLYFTVLVLKYAYSHLKLTAETAKQCNLNFIGGQATGTYNFLAGFGGLADMPAES